MPRYKIKLNIEDIIEAEDESEALEKWAQENMDSDGDLFDWFDVEEVK
jgi:hypothetical protein